MMVIKKYGQTSSLGRRSVSDKRIDRRAKRQEEEEKNAGFVEQTAVYDKSAGGVITSEGDFYETKDTSWRPEGFVNLGSRSALMVKKSQGGKQIGSRDNRGIPDAKVYSAYSDKYMEGKDTGNFDIIKNAMGNVIEIRAKPKTYVEYRHRSNNQTHQERIKNYNPTVAKFDNAGNIISEIKFSPFLRKQNYQDNDNYSVVSRVISPDIVKEFKNNQLVKEKDYDLRTSRYRSGKGYDKSEYGTYLKSEKNYDTGMKTLFNKVGWSGRVKTGGRDVSYENGNVKRVRYADGRDYEMQRYSQPNVINNKLMIRDMANKMALSNNTKTSNRLKNFLRGGQSNLTFGSLGKSNNLTFGSSTPVVKNKQTNSPMQSIASEFQTKKSSLLQSQANIKSNFFNTKGKAEQKQKALFDIRSKI